MKLVSALLVCLALASTLSAQQVEIVPQPFAPIHAQEHHKQIDWPSVITLTAGNLADNITTTHGLSTGRCHESNVFLGPHPSTASLYLNSAVELGSFVVLNLIAERSHSKRVQAISRVLNYSIGGIHGFTAIQNLRMCG